MSNIRRFIWVWWRRSPRSLDIAKPAAAGAGVAEDHDGGGGGAGLPAGPTLSEVGAPGLLADGVELELPELGLDGGVLGPSGDRLLHPLRLRKRLLLRPDLHRVREVGEVRQLGRQPAPEVG